MGLYLLDYGAGNKLGHDFKWVTEPEDFHRATSLLFPGVGAFETAIGYLESKGLLQPLKDPYFGICIGMQKFDASDKAVPHMGWNSADLVDPNHNAEGVKPSDRYYFVHSYRAKYDVENYPEAMTWVHTTSQYRSGDLCLRPSGKGNVFGTQFHPEKSGHAGVSSPAWTFRANDHGDLVVTKGDQYDVREKTVTADAAGAVRNLGKPVALAAKYFEAGADELCLLNITSFRHSPLRDQPMLAVVRAAAECVFDSIDPDGTKRPALEVAGAYFRAGADKVSIGSEAVYAVERLRASGWQKGDGTSAIETIAHTYGRQAVVVSIDPKRVYVDPKAYDGPYRNELVYGKDDGPEIERNKAWWYQCTVSGGREAREVSVVELAKGSEILGAGEILVNLIDRDGTGLGFDLDLVNLVKKTVSIPVVASSGAGSAQHFVDVFQKTPVEAALAAGIFHREEVKISAVKKALKESSINVRD
ncbi:imidazole glycerol phosphate synthase HisHF [Coprinellus micaceus]|uniref:Imidazole glycerol phosphate synthase HisHF n=1 Tax=Coprinellus micaceus TaxID=71717 RepID=A0A4Y7TLY1_COPMI|nr:imidazole glycerol phosphate synthase HisHF [Coprinellus micaceus]